MSTILERISAVTLKTDEITIPEWGVEIGVREMTARERVEFGANAKNIPHAAAVRLIIDCATDPATGAKLFETCSSANPATSSTASRRRFASCRASPTRPLKTWKKTRRRAAFSLRPRRNPA